MIVEGIDRIAPADFVLASLGYGIKLLAVIEQDFAARGLGVPGASDLLPSGSVIANVGGALNAVSATGDVVGTTLYIGRGASGTRPRARSSATLPTAQPSSRPARARTWPAGGPRAGGCRLGPLSPHPRALLLSRLTVDDRPGVLARVATVMGRGRVSIATVMQHASERAGAASLVLTTHESDEASLQATLRRLGRLGSVLERPLLLRIGDFGDNS